MIILVPRFFLNYTLQFMKKRVEDPSMRHDDGEEITGTCSKYNSSQASDSISGEACTTLLNIMSIKLTNLR